MDSPLHTPYALRYTVPFAAVTGERFAVLIEEQDYTGSPVQLQPAAQPFTVTLDEPSDHFLYTPVLASTARLRIVSSDVMPALFSEQYRRFRVTLVSIPAYADESPAPSFLLTCPPRWCGFIRPELYQQDYAAPPFLLEIECESALSTLRYVRYHPLNGRGTRSFISFSHLFQLLYSESRARYADFLVPHVFAEDAGFFYDPQPVWNSMLVSEQNFFDDNSNAWTLYDLAQQLAVYLGFTIHDYTGSLTFRDIDQQTITPAAPCADPTPRLEYFSLRYTEIQSGALDPETGLPLPPACAWSWLLLSDASAPRLHTLTAGSSLPIRGASHTLDILPGYNRVTVKASPYEPEAVMPDEDFPALDLLQSYRRQVADTFFRIYYLRPLAVSCFLYQYERTGNTYQLQQRTHADYDATQWTIASDSTSRRVLAGATPARYASYTAQSDVTDLSYQSAYWIGISANTPSVTTPLFPANNRHPVLRITSPGAVFFSGAFAIDTFFLASLPWSGSFVQAPAEFDDTLTMHTYEMYFTLRIGEWFFHRNESEWVWDHIDDRHTPRPDMRNILYPDFGQTGGSRGKYAKWCRIKSDRTLDDQYDSLSGRIIPLPSFPLYGDVELTVYAPCVRFGLDGATVPAGIWLRDFSFRYAPSASEAWRTTQRDEAVYYENTVNASYINERPELEFKFCTARHTGAGYAYVILSGSYLTSLWYQPVGEHVVPEALHVRRVVSRYDHTRRSLRLQLLLTAALGPLSVVTDPASPALSYIPYGGEIDYKNSRFTALLIEL